MIVVLCGPPGSGKTTVATRLWDRLAAAGHSFELLHSDDFSRRPYDRMSERVADAPGSNWLLDGTFYRREWRERFRDLGDAKVVYLAADLETCLRRNEERAEPIDERGVRAIYRRFEEPDADVTIDTDEVSPERAVDRLCRAIGRWLVEESE
ncbi:AAA family ATPase [Halegenticoccus soli]|uniref:AAA family ATPase n=1 Tax=Halegenticoccus soli TaxID=1985678 RepID=UPI000C6DBB44|nr:AAA family ATPase [Halegenticoccus soli]